MLQIVVCFKIFWHIPSQYYFYCDLWVLIQHKLAFFWFLRFRWPNPRDNFFARDRNYGVKFFWSTGKSSNTARCWQLWLCFLLDFAGTFPTQNEKLCAGLNPAFCPPQKDDQERLNSDQLLLRTDQEEALPFFLRVNGSRANPEPGTSRLKHEKY